MKPQPGAGSLRVAPSAMSIYPKRKQRQTQNVRSDEFKRFKINSTHCVESFVVVLGQVLWLVVELTKVLLRR